MSAPQTNVEKQRRRHRPALIGIVASLCIAGLAAAVFILWGGLPSDEQAAPDIIPPVEATD